MEGLASAARDVRPDGSLGEVHVALPGEGAALRGMMGNVAAVSLGLQHGALLEDCVAAFTRFGPAGRLEGDADTGHATSLPGCMSRNLATNALGHVATCPRA